MLSVDDLAKSSLGEEKEFISPHTLLSVTEGSQGGTQAEAEEECCFNSGLLSLLFYIILNHLPRGGSPTAGGALILSLIKKTPHRLAYRPI